MADTNLVYGDHGSDASAGSGLCAQSEWGEDMASPCRLV